MPLRSVVIGFVLVDIGDLCVIFFSSMKKMLTVLWILSNYHFSIIRCFLNFCFIEFFDSLDLIYPSFPIFFKCKLLSAKKFFLYEAFPACAKSRLHA